MGESIGENIEFTMFRSRVQGMCLTKRMRVQMGQK